MPGPVFPPKPDEKPKRPGFNTNVRNTASKHWTLWLQGTEVTVGKVGNRGGRCIVPATAFPEPDKNTPKGAVEWRWFERADKLPFFFAGTWRPWTGSGARRSRPTSATICSIRS